MSDSKTKGKSKSKRKLQKVAARWVSWAEHRLIRDLRGHAVSGKRAADGTIEAVLVLVPAAADLAGYACTDAVGEGAGEHVCGDLVAVVECDG